MTLAFTRRGTGPPLVLLHGIGSARNAWDPIIDALAERFDVLAIDLPGFGESPPLLAGVEPRPAAIAAGVAAFLDSQDVVTPHVAGHSLGGWVALELAAIYPLGSLTLLSPAGLWHGKTPLYNRISLHATRWVARHFTGFISRLMRYRAARVIILGQTHARPARLPASRSSRSASCIDFFSRSMTSTDTSLS